MNVGELKHQCEVQRLTTTTDENGFQVQQWTTVAKPRCKIEFDDRLIREIFKDDGITTTSVKIFTFRYFEGLLFTDRIFYKGKGYEIYGLNNVNEKGNYYKVWARAID